MQLGEPVSHFLRLLTSSPETGPVESRPILQSPRPGFRLPKVVTLPWDLFPTPIPNTQDRTSLLVTYTPRHSLDLAPSTGRPRRGRERVGTLLEGRRVRDGKNSESGGTRSKSSTRISLLRTEERVRTGYSPVDPRPRRRTLTCVEVEYGPLWTRP